MQIETFNDHEEHEMDIDLPNSDLNTDTNIITTRHHVKIDRDDFELTGDAMIFNTVTKQGGLSGNVHMIIYDMKSKTGRSDEDMQAATAAQAKTPAPKTPEPKN
jgi:lipopolysaccharide assembly outer membrane protein LptD (OstA)